MLALLDLVAAGQQPTNDQVWKLTGDIRRLPPERLKAISALADPRERIAEMRRTIDELTPLVAKEDRLATEQSAAEAARRSRQLGEGPLVDMLPRRLMRAVDDLIGPNENVHIRLRGLNGEVLVCTDARVIILKAGFFTGQFFGSNTYQLPYANIAGAEVRAHLVTAYFQLNAGGMNSTDMSVWNMRWGPTGTPPRRLDPARAPNAIALSRAQVARFREASAFIMGKVAEAHRPTGAASAAAQTTINQQDVLDALERLGRLKDAGVLTQDEFDSKKAELLGRL